MPNPRSNGPRGNGADAPTWARELSAEVRAVLKRGEERDARHASGMAEYARRADDDRRQAVEDRARHNREMAKAIAVATRVGIQIRHDIQAVHGDIRLLHQENRRTLDAVHELTGSIDKLVRLFLSRRNGRGGNGRRFKA